MHPLFALLGSVLLGVVAQVLLKMGAARDSFAAQILDWRTIFGLGLYGVGAFFYIYALRKLPLSVAFPTVAASYVLVAFAGWAFFREALALPQWLGLGLILAGVYFLHRAA